MSRLFAMVYSDSTRLAVTSLTLALRACPLPCRERGRGSQEPKYVRFGPIVDE